jgi:hypothetical protein
MFNIINIITVIINNIINILINKSEKNIITIEKNP